MSIPFRPQRPAGDGAAHPLNAGIGLQEVRFRRAVDSRMEGIDEMWMPCEYRRPYKVPVLGEPYSMYGGWSRTEQGAADRDTLHAAGPEQTVLVS